MRPRGFTLIEVMVALAIVGLALPALIFQVMSNIDSQAYLRDKAFAQWIAQNRLAEMQLQRILGQRVLSGTSSGFETMAGVRWEWRINALPSGVEGMRRFELEVGLENKESLHRSVGFIHE
jgi:general secretion pathway protein I